MRKLVFIAVLFLLATIGGGVYAQDGDGDDDTCTPDDVDAVLASAINTLEAVRGEDTDVILGAMRETRHNLATLDSQCNSLSFSGTKNAVFGPVDIPSGIYRATVSIDAPDSDIGIPTTISITYEILEGECGGYGSSGYLFMVVGDGEQTIFESEGCSLLWETEYFPKEGE